MPNRKPSAPPSQTYLDAYCRSVYKSNLEALQKKIALGIPLTELEIEQKRYKEDFLNYGRLYAEEQKRKRSLELLRIAKGLEAISLPKEETPVQKEEANDENTKLICGKYGYAQVLRDLYSAFQAVEPKEKKALESKESFVNLVGKKETAFESSLLVYFCLFSYLAWKGPAFIKEGSKETKTVSTQAIMNALKSDSLLNQQTEEK